MRRVVVGLQIFTLKSGIETEVSSVFNILFTVWNLLLHTSQTSNLQAWLFNNKISLNGISIKWLMGHHCNYWANVFCINYHQATLTKIQYFTVPHIVHRTPADVQRTFGGQWPDKLVQWLSTERLLNVRQSLPNIRRTMTGLLLSFV